MKSVHHTKGLHLRSFVLGALVTSFGWYIVLVLLDRHPPTHSTNLSSVSPPTVAIFCPQGTNPLSNVFQGLNSITPKDQLVIDVGAFDGKDSIIYARAGHRVLAFEPSPSKIPKIQANLKRSGMSTRVRLYDIALSNENTIRPFQISLAIDPNEIAFMGHDSGSAQDSFAVPWNTNVQTVDVRVRRLDDVLEELGESRVLMLKIDAQGFDFDVLRGADKLLSEHRVRIVTFEFAIGLMPHKMETARRLLHYLYDRGYHCSMCGGGLTRDGSRAPILSVDFESYIHMIGTKPFYYRGVNHGAWDNLVCMY